MKPAPIVAAAVMALCIGGALLLYAPDRSRPWLEARYGSPADTTCTVLGVRLRVRDTGPRNAAAIILLHGFASSLQTWEGWAGPLSTNHRVVRFDLPGFGLTGADPTGDYSDARAMQLLDGLMDQLGIARADLIGNSLGGKIAWQFAARHPGRVNRLVLVSPDGFASPGFDYGKAPRVPAVARLLPYTLPAPLVRMSLAPAYADPRRLTPALVARYRNMMLAPGVRRAMLARMGQVMLADPVPLLRSIAAPTLILWGERDGMIPYGNAADYLRALPHATLRALPTLGHVPFEEAPAATIGAVQAFLNAPPG